MICTQCGFQNPAGMRFCGGCGAPLEQAETPVSERRLVSVVFCDLVGSMQLSAQLDAEDLTEVLNAYQGMASRVVRDYDGHVAQFLGDGILIYFGYPRAHEDDGIRAVRASLEITRNMQHLNQQIGLPDVQLAARVGVETGSVVTTGLGSHERQEHLALGQTPNIAARLQSLATPNGVVIGEQTWRLVSRHVECEALGAQTIKGIPIPMQVYRAVRMRSAADDDDSDRASFIGREEELGVLLQHFHAAASNPRDGTVRQAGSTLLIRGEPGVGKSRLIRAFRRDIADKDFLWIETRCSAYESATPLHPLTSLLGRMLRLGSQDDPEWRLKQLRSGLTPFEPRTREVLPYFAALLDLPLPDDQAVLNVRPEKRLERTIALLIDLILHWSANSRVVLLIEDLHWADPTTLSLLARLSEPARNASLLVITAARITHEPEWAGEQVRRLDLESLSPEATISLATRIAQHPMTAEVAQLLLERTDGIPLFIEELTLDMIEAGAIVLESGQWRLQNPTAAADIPSTLQSSLVARIDRLGTVKSVAQTGAVFGREFELEDLCRVFDGDESVVRTGIARLLASGLLRRKPGQTDETYVFKHALVQEAAYNMLLRRHRLGIHGRIALMLEQHDAELIARKPEIIARHYSEAGMPDPASAYWLAAGQKALGGSAVHEAHSHLQEGLRQTAQIADATTRDQRELSLRLVLAGTLTGLKGFVAPEVREACLQALDLAQKLGHLEQQFWALIALRQYHMVRGEILEAHRLGESSMQIAEEHGDDSMRGGALVAMATNKFYLGEFESCLELATQSLSRTTGADNEFRNRIGFDVAVLAALSQALALWHLGEGARAVQIAEESIAAARKSGHDYTLALALVFGGMEIKAFAGDPVAVSHRARELDSLSQNRGYLDWQLQAGLFGGWSGALLGETRDERSESAAMLAGILHQMKSKQNLLSVSFFCGLLADAYLHLGELEAAQQMVREGIDVATATGDRMWMAELHRLLGEIILNDAQRPDRFERANEQFLEAIELAGRQGSRALRLRAAISLTRLERQQGQGDAGLELLRCEMAFLQGRHLGADLESAAELLRQEA